MTTLAEPEWDQASRDLALGHAEVKLCPRCGGPAYLCQDPALQNDWIGDDPTRCHRMTAIYERQARLDPKSSPHSEALMWQAHLRQEGR